MRIGFTLVLAALLGAGCSGTSRHAGPPDAPERTAYTIGDPEGYYRANVEWIVDEDDLLNALGRGNKVHELPDVGVWVRARRAPEFGPNKFAMRGECANGCVAVPVPTPNGFVYRCDCRPIPENGLYKPIELADDFECRLEFHEGERGLDQFSCTRGVRCRGTCQLSYVWDPDWDAFVMACVCIDD